MPIGRWIARLRPRTGLEELTDIEGWRNYYFDLVLRLALVLMPVGVAAALPSLIAGDHYAIIACDVAGFVALFIMAFTVRDPRKKGILLIVFFNALAIVFFAVFGPFFARPGWLVLGAVTVALLLGTKAALAVTGFYAALLIAGYWLVGPHIKAWAPIYDTPPGTWLVFVTNISIIALIAGLPVSLLLKRLDISFSKEVDLRKKVSAEGDAVKGANAALEGEIAERKRAEDALREGELFVKSILETTPSLIYIYDVVERRNVYANQRMANYVGYPPMLMQMIGPRLFPIVLHPDDLPAISAHYRRMAAAPEGFVGEIEYRMKHVGGEWRWLRSRDISFKRDAHGRLQQILGSAEDVTERKRAREALKESETNLREAQSIAKLGTWTFEPALNRLQWSETASQIFELDPSRGLGRYEAFLDAVHPEDRDAVRLAYAELLANGTPCNISHRLVMPDGRVKWVNAACQADPGPEGRPVLLRGIVQDITEQKAMESQLFEAQKMEAMGVLAGGIAHDFNNILGSIIGYTELAAEQPDVDARRHCIEQVLYACDRAKNLVRQILAFSRRTEGEKKPVDLRVVVKETLKLLGSTIPATVTIRRHIAGEMHMVLADPTQMHQILMNLCTNAVHAMGEAGGILTVRLTHEEDPNAATPDSPDAVPGSFMKLTVSDTGCGIEAAIINRIFDPFFTTKPVEVGTGLGLSVVYGIVRNHGGTVSVASVPGEGTTFTVCLPCSTETQPRRAEASIPIEGSRGSERILFLDDEKPLANLGKSILASLGYNVTAHTDSMEALKAFRSNPRGFDLVITDMAMPRMTGKELAGRILALRPDMPVIICTGYSDYINDESALRLGIRAFVMKPFSRRDLAHIVRKTLDGGRAAA